MGSSSASSENGEARAAAPMSAAAAAATSGNVPTVEEPTFRKLLLDVLLELMSDRYTLQLVTKDSRWTSLEVGLLRKIFDQDNLAIVNEIELLSLLERWNANRDKNVSDVGYAVGAFRLNNPDPSINQASLEQLIMFCSNSGLIHGDTDNE